MQKPMKSGLEWRPRKLIKLKHKQWSDFIWNIDVSIFWSFNWALSIGNFRNQDRNDQQKAQHRKSDQPILTSAPNNHKRDHGRPLANDYTGRWQGMISDSQKWVEDFILVFGQNDAEEAFLEWKVAERWGDLIFKNMC